VDVVLMDVTMPRLSGVEATRALKAAFPEMIVLMLTQADDDDDHLFAAEVCSTSRWPRATASRSGP
jgi:DNA-binding NarL/FixJ family response regulator